MVSPEAESFKRRVKDATDIVQVVSERTTLARSGRGFKGLCPFHDEKTPSFHVNPEGQFYKCFGCGKGGDAFSFVMDAERVDFPQALALLAERARIPMPDFKGSRSPEEIRLYEEGKNLLYRLNEFAARFFETRLWGEEGAVARAYLEERGLSRESAERFRLGCAPDSWDGLCRELTGRRAAGRHLVSAGLALERKDGTGIYDRFRNRLVFPITDAAGRCVGFGARALSGADNPKYLNSPETPIFSKGQLLFGLQQAREALGEPRRLMLMEGYTDVIMAAQKGFPNAVATLGTGLTRDHLRLLRRFADTVLILYDTDQAGLDAAERGLDLFFEAEVPARVVTLEPGLDPCDYLIKHGPEAFAERLAASVDLFEFKLGAVRSGHDLGTAHGRRAAVRELMETVAQVADPVMAAELRRRAAEAFGLPESVLAAELAAKSRQRRPDPAESADATDPSDRVRARLLNRRRQAERLLAQALLAYPQGLAGAARELADFSRLADPATGELLRTAARIYADLGELRIEELATALSGAEAVALVAEVAALPQGRSVVDDPAGRVAGDLRALRRIDLEEEKTGIEEEMRSAAGERQLAVADRIAEIQRELQGLKHPAGSAAAAGGNARED